MSSPEPPRRPLAVYVHWPFCRSKCPYCDFNSQAAGGVDEGRWRRALLAELASEAERTNGRQIASVFFGGGTPSLMAPDTVAAILDGVRARWPTDEAMEVTLEANPTTAEAGRFRAFREAGVNRISIGVQSFDDAVLAFLGRTHGAREACAAIALAAERFSRWSFDLIYAWPGQELDHWRRELEAAAVLAGEHVSLYQLTIEPGTPFHRRSVRAAGEDLAAALYDLAQETLANAGLPAYEIANHCRPGGECRHNLAIWQGGDYIGIGPGAHGRATVGGRTVATRRIAPPEPWLARVEAAGHGTQACTILSEGQRRQELVLMGLRLTKGLERRHFEALTGLELEDAMNRDGLAELVAAGLVTVDTDGLRATPAGRPVLDALIRTLLA